MKLAKCYSGAIFGVDAHTVEIEVSSTKGAPQFTIVGLPDQAVRESKDRVTTALENSGFKRFEENITVNLAPANVRKEGPIYDLPIAVALLVAVGRLSINGLDEWGMIGELALSGEVRKVQGVLPIVLEMKRIGMCGVIVPFENAEEASVVDGVDVYPVRTLREAVSFLSGESEIAPMKSDLYSLLRSKADTGDDFADVKGQGMARRAIEVAVSGGHNMLMVGSPGSGKTMLARRIPSILPPLTVGEALDVTRIHSVAGIRKADSALVLQRPFRSPHHTVSDAGLLGGGAHPMPGEVSLAHRGVLFLDELPEFRRNVLEVMRQPLEDGFVSISRAAAACVFPSSFMLVAAMNPCPCGWADDPTHTCRCSFKRIHDYRSRISGPLLDRIDIQIEVPPVPVDDLAGMPNGESSAEIRARVVVAREVQSRRLKDIGARCNAEIKSRYLNDICRLDSHAQVAIRDAIRKLDLSARAYDRVLRVSRTIADLEGTEDVNESHVFEATQFRALDRDYWN